MPKPLLLAYSIRDIYKDGDSVVDPEGVRGVGLNPSPPPPPPCFKISYENEIIWSQ